MTFPTPLVTTEWLAAHLDATDLLIFDASAYMPAEGKDGRSEYLLAQIPGARFFDVDEIADPETKLPHMAPSQGRFSRLVGTLGLSSDKRVVVYDQKGLFSAARAWWLLRLFGHEQVAVLDGGLPKWMAENRPLEAGDPSPLGGALFLPAFRTELLRGLGDVLKNCETGREQVIDARSRERFEGTAPDPRPGLVSGHIPGSISTPYVDLLNPDKTLKSADALRAYFIAAGLDEEKPVVCSCGSGLSACILSLGLMVAGFGPGAVYDGSWTEWASSPGVPIAKK